MNSPLSRDSLLCLLRRLRDAAEAYAGSEPDALSNRVAYDELDAALNEVNGALETEPDKVDDGTHSQTR